MNVTVLIPPKLLVAFQQIEPSTVGYSKFRDAWSELCLCLEYELDPSVEFAQKTLELYTECLIYLIYSLSQDD